MIDKLEKNGIGWKMWAGIWASLLYAAAAIYILVMNLCYSPPSPTLGLNGIGDYLAGVFSPLAFLWLVIGYVMQNRELKNSVEQTRQAHNLAWEQLEFQKKIKSYEITKEKNDAQANFFIRNDKTKLIESENKISLNLRNIGNTATDVQFLILDEHEKSGFINLGYNEKIFKNESITLKIDMPKEKLEKLKVEGIISFNTFTIFFVDTLGEDSAQEFKLNCYLNNGEVVFTYPPNKLVKPLNTDFLKGD